MRHRNPYIILGIPFGSSRAQANIAFARKAREARRQGAGAHDRLTDLTWALNQVDEAISNPSAEMGIYRIPADPAVFATVGHGVLAPPPETMPSRAADREAALAQLQDAVAHEYLQYLAALRSGQIVLPGP